MEEAPYENTLNFKNKEVHGVDNQDCQWCYIIFKLLYEKCNFISVYLCYVMLCLKMGEAALSCFTLFGCLCDIRQWDPNPSGCTTTAWILN